MKKAQKTGFISVFSTTTDEAKKTVFLLFQKVCLMRGVRHAKIHGAQCLCGKTSIFFGFLWVWVSLLLRLVNCLSCLSLLLRPENRNIFVELCLRREKTENLKWWMKCMFCHWKSHSEKKKFFWKMDSGRVSDMKVIVQKTTKNTSLHLRASEKT